MALGSASMIYLPIYSSISELESASDSEDFTSATSDCFEPQSIVFLPRALMEVAPLPGIFLCLSGVLLCLWLVLVVLILSIFALSFVRWVGATLSWLLL